MGGAFSQKLKARFKRKQHIYDIPTDSDGQVYQTLEKGYFINEVILRVGTKKALDGYVHLRIDKQELQSYSDTPREYGLIHESGGQERHNLKTEKPTEEIEAFVDANEALIVNCVNVMDMLPHLKFIEDTGTFRERQRLGKRASMQLLLRKLRESKEPGKWQYFFRALIKEGYEHISNRLLVQSESDYTTNREVIKELTEALTSRMNPDDILVHIVAASLISQADSEEIRCELTNAGPKSASKMILERIQTRRENWFSIFMGILKRCGLEDITDKLQTSELHVETSHRYHEHVIQQRPMDMNHVSEVEKTVTPGSQEVMSRISAIESKLSELLTEFKAFISKGEPCTSGHSKQSNDDHTSHYEIESDEEVYSYVGSESTTPNVCVENESMHGERYQDGSAFSDDGNIYETLGECSRPEKTTPNECDEGKGKGLKQSLTYVDENSCEKPEQCMKHNMIKESNDEPLSGISDETARQIGRAGNVERPKREDDEMNGVANPRFHSCETNYEEPEEPDTCNEFESARRSECGSSSSANADERICDTCVNAVYEICEIHGPLIRSDYAKPKGCVRKAERSKGAIGETISVGNPSFNANEEHCDYIMPEMLDISSKDNICESCDSFGIDEPIYENIECIKHFRQESNRAELVKQCFTVVDGECVNYTSISAHSIDMLY